jgi:Flp pilus assembly protein TadG
MDMKTILNEARSAMNQRGVTAILVALLLVVLVGFTALAIDVGHLVLARNELQNAADAGALAGARFLYIDEGTSVNLEANDIAEEAATANMSENLAVEVQRDIENENEGDVQRGHWCFATRTFTPNASLLPVDLWNATTEELDADPYFINAIRVVTRRQGTPVASFFAWIFGHQGFQVSTEAIGYIGFAGTLEPGEADQPIAICKEALLDGSKEYTCSVGRMINSGQNVASHETGGWTSFNQDDPCTGGTNAQEVRDLVCNEGNPDGIKLGQDIATNGGEIQSAFNKLIQCWEDTTGKTVPWNLTLSVIICPGNNVGTCEETVGAVNINIVWITDAGEDPEYTNAPWQMGDWSNNDPDGQVRWNSFVGRFNLQDVDGTPCPYEKKSIYFLPDCTYHEPAGVSGGENFGILAKVPVLVH